ncbi:hypothetical protein [Methylobacterium longum]|uniref:Phage protein n=1 Tax=Methylobacterium longum TaxID=767694 RepID=A0ABT8AZ78_9HYPH|nr:hypothetical protein [Methylobacterium longum]MDN3575119.1 hypothetical protein [Methylobacterium longum]
MTDKVDTSSFSAKTAAKTRDLQAQLAAAPNALLELHDAVLGLPNFYIERTDCLGFVVWDGETAARNGHRIEVSPWNEASIIKVERRGGSGPAQDDLLPVGVPRRLVVLVTSTIVILNGQHGDRPYVPEVVVERMRPVYDGRGKRASGYVPVYETGVQEIVEARATYAAWHAALGMLAAQLAGLPEVEVTGPTAPAKPWRQTGQVLIGTAPTDLRDEPIKPQKQRRRPRPSTQSDLGPSGG